MPATDTPIGTYRALSSDAATIAASAAPPASSAPAAANWAAPAKVVPDMTTAAAVLIPA